MTSAGLDTAIHVVAYEWSRWPGAIDAESVLDGIAAAQKAAVKVALAEPVVAVLYARLVRLTALGFAVLAALPPPDDLLGLDDFNGFGEWMKGLES